MRTWADDNFRFPSGWLYLDSSVHFFMWNNYRCLVLKKHPQSRRHLFVLNNVPPLAIYQSLHWVIYRRRDSVYICGYNTRVNQCFKTYANTYKKPCLRLCLRKLVLEVWPVADAKASAPISACFVVSDDVACVTNREVFIGEMSFKF